MEITKDTIAELILKIAEENQPFQNEFEFQFEFAMAIKEWSIEKNQKYKIKIEQKVYPNTKGKENCRCDIVVCDRNNNDKKLLFAELKYVVTEEKQSNKQSYRHRSYFIDDLKRLKSLTHYPNAKKYCIFITNKTATYKNNTLAQKDRNVEIFNKLFAQYNKDEKCNSNWFPVKWGNSDTKRDLPTYALIIDNEMIKNLKLE